MLFKKSETQLYFEQMFLGNGGKPFKGLKKDIYESTFLSEEQASNLSAALDNEIGAYYYKALLSCLESFEAIETHNYSWATVRLYYSTFYACKAYLSCKGVAILRAERKLYYAKAKKDERIKRCQEHTDHKGTMFTLQKLYKEQDLLQSNTIDDKMVYEWMMNKREEVNYKDIEFHDPSPPEFWGQIEKGVRECGLREMIDMFVDDNWVYCFQEEYGVLGIPIKRLILTVEEIRRTDKIVDISEEKRAFIERYLHLLSINAQNSFILWK